MKQYLKEIARFILKDELIKLEESRLLVETLSRDKEKLLKKLKKFDTPQNVILNYYRIDNVAPNGMPPSYLQPENPTEYIQRVSELESVYRNGAFRELIAWSLNFHANLSVSGEITNDLGDQVHISSEKANDMIKGIRSIWDLIVAAHMKDAELSRNQNTDAHQALLAEMETE